MDIDIIGIFNHPIENSFGFKVYSGITVTIELPNESISWDAVMDMTSCGFESATWCSSVNPYDMQDINVFSDNELKSGADQNIWYVTKAARVSFGDKTWGHMDEETFYYVPVLEPVKIRMKLDME